MRLYVNIDHVATVRQARRTNEPDPVHAALEAELAGADAITVHLRKDRRHIQDRDVRLLSETVRSGLNLELAASDEMVEIACAVRPMQATLVPESREEITTEGGLDLSTDGNFRTLRGAVEKLSAAGVRTSLFIDPVESAIDRSLELGVDAIELHTGEYANAETSEARALELERLHSAARRARDRGLAVHAGHGLTYTNVVPVAALPEIEELNIGHSIVSRSLLVGIGEAVREMRRLIREAPMRVPQPGAWIPPIGH